MDSLKKYRKYIFKDSSLFDYEYNNTSEDEFVNLDMGIQQINDLVVTSCIILSFCYIHLFSECMNSERLNIP